MRDTGPYAFTQDERPQALITSANIAYFILVLFALASFSLSLYMAAMAVSYIPVPAEYSEILTESIACKASGLAAFLGLGLACFASLNKLSR